MYSDKRTVRGIKRKLTDNEDDEQHIKPKTKFKDDDHREDTPEISGYNLNEGDDLNDKENNELKIDFLVKHPTTNTVEDEFNNNINDILNSTSYDDLNDEIQKELNNDINFNLNNAGESNEEANDQNGTFNTFLNSSLSQCCVNSNRPLTPLPQLNPVQTTPLNSSSNPVCIEQSTPQLVQQTDANSSTSQPQSSSSSTNQQLSFNQFPITSISNTKLFNSTSSSLFNAAAIVDTYFSSTTKKSRLEKAKNMNHFRYSLFNKSLAKLNKFCNSSDPNIRNSVLVCNTLKRLERQLRKENIYLHLTPNGLAFIKLKNKHSPEQLDYRNLVLDETSQIYVEKDATNDESDEEDEDNEKFIDTDIDFNAAKQNDSSNSCSSESDSDEMDENEDQSDEFSDDLNSEFNNNEYNESTHQMNNDQKSPSILEPRSSSPLCNNQSDLSTYLNSASTILVNNSSSLVNNISISVDDDLNSCTGITSNQLSNNWTEESSNQFNWNIFPGLVTLNDQQSVINSTPKEDELVDSSSYLFNSIDQSVVGQTSTSTDELFSDIDSLITLYDLDLLTSVSNTKSNELSSEQTKIIGKSTVDDNETKSSSSSQDSDTTLYTLDSAIGSMNNSLNNSLNNSSINASSSSLNNSSSINSATSCSTSASVNSSSTSFASNQGNNAISPVIS